MDGMDSMKSWLGTKALYRETLRLGLPIALQTLIAVGMNMIDTVMLGRMGDACVSAASFAGQYVTMGLICAMAVGMGAGVLATRFYGMGDRDSLKQTITIMLRCELLVAVAFTIAAGVLPHGVIGLFTEDAAVIGHGATYLRMLLPAYCAMCFSQGCTIVLRSAGVLWMPMLASALGLGVNALCNWVLIYGNLGVTPMGVLGAALATTIAWLAQMLVVCGYFFFAERDIAYRLRDLRTSCKALVKPYLQISLPLLVGDTLFGLGNSAISVIMGRMGVTYGAANSVTVVVQQFSTVLQHGAAGASGIITGYTLGRGEQETAQRQGYAFVTMGVGLGLLAAVGILLLRGPLLSYYQVSAEAKAVAWQLINGMLVTVVLQSVNGILTKGVLRAGGDTKFLMVGDVLFLWVISVPLGALAGLVWRLPPFWVYVSLKADQMVKCVWCVARLYSGKWVRQIGGSS